MTMKLDDFYARIGPLLLGQATLEEAASSLYGLDWREQKDARRLAIYARFCRIHRHEVLEGVYPYCHQVVLARRGEAAWAELVAAYFAGRPMESFELNENGAEVPDFLAGYAEGAGLPSWLAGLADFEWWEWQTSIQREEPDDEAPGQGVGRGLRLAPTVELRRYGHDYVRWLDEDNGPAGEPAPEETLVLFWRDQDMDARREKASQEELRVLGLVMRGEGLEELAAQGLMETAADLLEAGIVLGGGPPKPPA
jgi:hypothetical protein